MICSLRPPKPVLSMPVVANYTLIETIRSLSLGAKVYTQVRSAVSVAIGLAGPRSSDAVSSIRASRTGCVECHMPGDPKECRKQAACCRGMAARSSNAVAREAFANLADTWDRLAVELEGTLRLAKVIEAIEAEGHLAPVATDAVQSAGTRLPDQSF